jgi:hypothetical protein
MNEERDTDTRLWHPWLRINPRPGRDAADALRSEARFGAARDGSIGLLLSPALARGAGARRVVRLDFPPAVLNRGGTHAADRARGRSHPQPHVRAARC